MSSAVLVLCYLSIGLGERRGMWQLAWTPGFVKWLIEHLLLHLIFLQSQSCSSNGSIPFCIVALTVNYDASVTTSICCAKLIWACERNQMSPCWVYKCISTTTQNQFVSRWSVVLWHCLQACVLGEISLIKKLFIACVQCYTCALLHNKPSCTVSPCRCGSTRHSVRQGENHCTLGCLCSRAQIQHSSQAIDNSFNEIIVSLLYTYSALFCSAVQSNLSRQFFIICWSYLLAYYNWLGFWQYRVASL